MEGPVEKVYLKASAENIRKGIEGLNRFNSTPQPGQGTTRVLFTPEEVQGREYVKALMRDAGLRVEEDAIGNIFGILEGESPDLPCIWSGSHIDTVLNAGMFDGMAGVIAAIESLRLIKASGAAHQRTLKAVVFTSEEPTRFGLCCLGSRAMAGRLKREELSSLLDEDGKSLEQVLMELGYDLGRYVEVRKAKDEVFASIELHIEQGAVLEKLGLPIGVVETICAPTNLEVTVTGVQEHAGSTPMNIRRDALVAAAEIVMAVEKLVKACGGAHTVGTVGRMEVFPNAANVIPGQVKFTIDIRDSVMTSKEIILKKIQELFQSVEKERDVSIEYVLNNHDIPRECNGGLNKVIRCVCDEMNILYHRMVSGAYHDSIFVSEFTAATMIFVPSKGGISHHHLEWTDFEEIRQGTDILTESMLRLANL